MIWPSTKDTPHRAIRQLLSALARVRSIDSALRPSKGNSFVLKRNRRVPVTSAGCGQTLMGRQSLQALEEQKQLLVAVVLLLEVFASRLQETRGLLSEPLGGNIDACAKRVMTGRVGE